MTLVGTHISIKCYCKIIELFLYYINGLLYCFVDNLLAYLSIKLDKEWRQ